MDIEKTIKSLERNGYKVSYFKTVNDVINYLSSIEGQTIAFGRIYTFCRQTRSAKTAR